MINGENTRTQLIFISQYLEYASDVYSTKHTYFIYKNRLNEYLPAALDAALKNLQTDEEQYLTIKIKRSHPRIPVNDILYLERNLRETSVHTRTEAYTVQRQAECSPATASGFFRVLPQKFSLKPSCSFQTPAYRDHFEHRSADSCQSRTL